MTVIILPLQAKSTVKNVNEMGRSNLLILELK